MVIQVYCVICNVRTLDTDCLISNLNGHQNGPMKFSTLKVNWLEG